MITSAGLATVLTALAYADNLLLAAQIRPCSRWRGVLTPRVGSPCSVGQFAEHNPVILTALLALATVTIAVIRGRRMIGGCLPLPSLSGSFRSPPFSPCTNSSDIIIRDLCFRPGCACLYLVRGGQWSDFFRIRLAPRMTRIAVLLVCCTDLLTVGISVVGRPPNNFFYSFRADEKVLDCRISVVRDVRQLIVRTFPDHPNDVSVLGLMGLTFGLGLRSASRFFTPCRSRRKT